MTIRVCSHRRLLLPMQSDVLNEPKQAQQQLSNDNDCSSSLSTTTTLIYSGLKLVRHCLSSSSIICFSSLASETTGTNDINAWCGKSIIDSEKTITSYVLFH